ncbi:MAG: 4-hydroxy-tetrahydrodipicolinate synthase [Gordonia sp. (in: high G+C Gram-positive bacteria)]
MTNTAGAEIFGTNLVAMATPMLDDGSLDRRGVDALVDHLVENGCDGLVVAGTTGEAPTLTAAETSELIGAVAARADGRARVIAGVGTYDTASTIRAARRAEEAGADALLVVCPYYSRPTQAGVVAHFTAVADAATRPVMLYDVPARTGLGISAQSLIELAAHPNIRGVKDAKGDLFEALTVMSQTSLLYYCGIDELNLAYLASGATGLVSVVGNIAPRRTRALIDAVQTGDLPAARAISVDLIGLTAALLGDGQGAVMSKAALAELGVVEHATVRLPLVEASAADRRALAAEFEALFAGI